MWLKVNFSNFSKIISVWSFYTRKRTIVCFSFCCCLDNLKPQDLSRAHLRSTVLLTHITILYTHHSPLIARVFSYHSSLSSRHSIMYKDHSALEMFAYSITKQNLHVFYLFLLKTFNYYNGIKLYIKKSF